MEHEMKFAENVMLVDVPFLNFVIKDLKRHYEKVLGRELNRIETAGLFVYFAYDAGMEGTDNQLQVLLVHDEHSEKLENCSPSDLEKELNNVAFKDSLGEFSFYTFRPEGITSMDDFFIESLKVLVEAREVKKLIVMTDFEKEENQVSAVLKEIKDKEVVLFRMSDPPEELSCRWEVLAYPVMQALGIRGDEL